MKKDDSITTDAQCFFWMGAFKKYVRSKFPIFDPLLPLLVPVRFACTPSPPQRRFALVSYPPPPSQKTLCHVYEFLNRKSGSDKREKLFFCNISMFSTQLIKKTLNEKKCLRLFNKKTPVYTGVGSKQQNV